MWSAAQRRRSLGERLQRISTAVDQMESHPAELTQGAAALLDYVAALLVQVRSTVDSRWSQLSVLDAVAREDLRRDLCDDFQDVIGVLGNDLLPVLVGADARFVPVELEVILQSAVAQAARSWSPRPVLYGSNYYDYSIVKFAKSEIEIPLAVMRDSHDVVAPTEETQPPDFLFISVPSVERDSAALHAVILGHELGHLWDWHAQVSKQLPLDVPEGLLDANGKPTDGYGEYIETATNWTEELVADIFSCLTIGPAALLWLPELNSTGGTMDVDFPSHPGSDRRVSLMLRVLEEQGFSKADGFEEVFAEYSKLYAKAWDRAIQGTDFGSATAASLTLVWIRDHQTDLIDHARHAVPADQVFGVDRWSDVLIAAGMLRRGLPCGELRVGDGRRVGASPQVVLNAAWLVKLHHLSALAGELGIELTADSNLQDVSKVADIVDRLALKSMEIASFLQKR